ncbi:MAG: hypothetical protein KDK64_00245 [Chlamydiia bacterium]|nr:hypothetical protein [Chlamydiia bacterium]
MEDEFEKIMAFFDLPPEEKEGRLQEVFEDSVEYFERFKYVMLNGTKEEKKEAVKRVMMLKKKIEEETQKVCEKTGMSPEQLAAFSNNPKNFSEDQWNAIEGAKKKLEKGVGEIKKAVKSKKPEGEAPPEEGGGAAEGEEKPKKRKKPPKNWIQS